MASTLSSPDRTLEIDELDDQRPGARSRGVSSARLWLRWGVIALVLIAILVSIGWATAWYAGTRGPVFNRAMKTAPARRGELTVLLTAEGNLESAVNIDIKCEVAGGSAILWIVEDGQQVKKGDKLVELDASLLEEEVNTQQITFQKARAAMIQAEKDFAAAKIAVQEYLEGTLVNAMLDAENKITIATENLRSAENTLEHSQRMFRKGYISALDLASQTFSVERAQLELDSANTAKEVLVKYTKEKTLQELSSKRDSAEALVRSETASFALEESRLKRLEAQLLKCIIMAPADGMVVYANETDRRGTSPQAQIEEGAAVRERQTMLRLPDLAQMQAKVNVHESSVDSLGRAMRRAERSGDILPARLEVQNLKLQGRLLSIANQPAPIDFRMGNIKQYPAIIAIDGTPQGLRPGMTAKCEVVVEQRPDTLMIPVEAVVEHGGEYGCWVVSKTGTERRPLLLGIRNDEVVEVQDGVRAGELVVLNPRATIPEARNVQPQTVPPKTGKRFDKILHPASDS
ncbi:MAG: TolC family protein [Pirellulaceae bacterium]